MGVPIWPPVATLSRGRALCAECRLVQRHSRSLDRVPHTTVGVWNRCFLAIAAESGDHGTQRISTIERGAGLEGRGALRATAISKPMSVPSKSTTARRSLTTFPFWTQLPCLQTGANAMPELQTGKMALRAVRYRAGGRSSWSECLGATGATRGVFPQVVRSAGDNQGPTVWVGP